MTGIGGHQGRALASGGLLGLINDVPKVQEELKIPVHMIPQYPTHWDLLAMSGPYDVGYLLPEDIDMLCNTEWKNSHNAARGGIRLIGPKPKWARKDGAEGGAHPSNIIEYGYPIGTLNWTGDDPCLFPIDCPDLGGFVLSTTIIKAEYWRPCQMKAGNTMRCHRVSLKNAIAKRHEVEEFLAHVDDCCKAKASFEDAFPLKYSGLPPFAESKGWGSAIVHQIDEQGDQPVATYRQGGDDFLLIDYGHGAFDLNFRCRTVAQEEMDGRGRERKTLERWNREKEEGKVSGDVVEELLHGM
jgi:urea carboxylase